MKAKQPQQAWAQHRLEDQESNPASVVGFAIHTELSAAVAMLCLQAQT